jgi:hypothetical protein
MAGVALDGKTLKLSHRPTLVAVCTIKPGVATHQGEAIVVLFYPLGNDAPTLHRMTLLAVRAHLPAVDVSMTIGAVRSRVRKDRLGVALRAGDSLVLAAQRVASRVVIEFRDSPDRLPSDRGMAVLARDSQVAMRASRN